MAGVQPADAEWLQRNLGIKPAPLGAVLTGAAAGPPSAAEERARQRELIDFDSEGPAGAAFLTAAPLAHGLSKFVPIPWPAGLAPVAGTKPTGSKLPKCDVLIVTWTVDEGHALSRVLTPGFDSRDDWVPYTRNFAAIAARMRTGCPARQAGHLGTYWTATIGIKRVTLFKSDSHMSQDGAKLPNATVWRQIIADSRPSLVITTGTGGGIGTAFEVGDVIVSPYVTFDCQRTFKRLDKRSYASSTAYPSSRFAKATQLFGSNAQFLPKDNGRPPSIIASTSAATGILTTDFFGFDNSTNTYGLQGKGDLSEMGDAVLGMVAKRIGTKAPAYVVVRNVSDPQIAAGTLTIREQEQIAAQIYKGFGRWSSVCSAIVCWAIVAGLQ
jgi:nucleoside phosphorylase